MKKAITIMLFLVLMVSSVNAYITGPASSGPSFAMSPNPVNGSYFDIQFDFTESEFPKTIINITNVLGQVVYGYQLKHVDFENGKVRIDLSDAKLDKGVYFVQLKSGDFTKTLKLAVR